MLKLLMIRCLIFSEKKKNDEKHCKDQKNKTCFFSKKGNPYRCKFEQEEDKNDYKKNEHKECHQDMPRYFLYCAHDESIFEYMITNVIKDIV